MKILLDKTTMLDQQLDRIQRGILGLGFLAFVIIYAVAANTKPDPIAEIPHYLLILPFVLLPLAILLIALKRYTHAQKTCANAKKKNIFLFNTLREMSAKANYDKLTGFPNKRVLEDRFSEAVNRAKRDKSLVLLYLVTLTDFHSIVSNHGDAVGADIIRMTGERLAGILRSTDTIVRLGSCEFVLLIESVNNQEGVAFLNQKIMKKLSRKFAINGIGSISAQEKVTTARFPWDGVTLDALMSAAVDELNQGRRLPRWVDALAAKLGDISPSQFAALRDTNHGTII